MARAYWNGFLKLSFVSCPVALYAATTAAERVSFRQVNRRTGHRIKHQLVDSVTGEAVEKHDKARGYEADDNQFLLVEDRELEQARNERLPAAAVEISEPARLPLGNSPTPAPASEEDDRLEEEYRGEDDAEEQEESSPRLVRRQQNNRTIEIERFVPADQVDGRYFEKPYYIVPRDVIGQEAFAVIRDAMTLKNVAGLARVVMPSRERPMLVAPMHNGLWGVTLRFAHEVRPESEYFSGIPEMKLPAEMMKLAQHIVETKSADFDHAMLEDHYRNALVRILRKKQSKRPALPPTVSQSRENIIDLMDALKRSIADARPAAKSVSRRVAAKRAVAKRGVQRARQPSRH